MSSDGGLPDDPALPQLRSALDGSVMAAHFADVLRGHGAIVEACTVERVKYRPRRNCTLSYRLQLRDEASGRRHEQRVAARLCSADEIGPRHARADAAADWVPSPAGPAMSRLPRLDMLTWWWPNDPKLMAPAVLAEARSLREQWLPPVLSVLATDAAVLTGHELEVVQYVPEHRLTARVDLHWQLGGRTQSQAVYAKSSREPDGASAHAILRTLQSSAAWQAGRLNTPRALLWQPQAQLHWQQGVGGRALLDLPPAQAAALAPSLGAQLAALHGIPVALTRSITPDAMRTRLAEVQALLADALPQAQADLARAVRRLARGMHWVQGQPLATLHGDLHPRNVLADGRHLSLIDLDGLRRGPALLELGSWWADGIYRAVLEGDAPLRDAPAWQGLLAGYAQGGGTPPASSALAWSAAWNLLTQRAWRCVVNLKPGRFAIAPRLVALAAELADAALPEAA
ncbi:aminoglycoside phosphotransferase family protein [Rhizobacter sp. AJA081-3]|uniref:phosphotransferase n=1 Tax=Rhizobacter sp. AJA081-3 TaxID=2753607 RepID=UPI001AE0B0C5|nr:aminoglycoside phosphotransferase family protein [Rhizobacter sp. AJA081-3]QTN23344.1 aminoglycoside phosphotransferase family protein [Rhizobacter sp. AJA081-3]